MVDGRKERTGETAAGQIGDERAPVKVGSPEDVFGSWPEAVSRGEGGSQKDAAGADAVDEADVQRALPAVAVDDLPRGQAPGGRCRLAELFPKRPDRGRIPGDLMTQIADARVVLTEREVGEARRLGTLCPCREPYLSSRGRCQWSVAWGCGTRRTA